MDGDHEEGKHIESDSPYDQKVAGMTGQNSPDPKKEKI